MSEQPLIIRRPEVSALVSSVTSGFHGLDEVAKILVMAFLSPDDAGDWEPTPWSSDDPTVDVGCLRMVDVGQSGKALVRCASVTGEHEKLSSTHRLKECKWPILPAAKVVTENREDKVPVHWVYATAEFDHKPRTSPRDVRGVVRHVLLEGPPGTGKSEIAKAMHDALIWHCYPGEGGRGQAKVPGTRELLPSDFLGTNMLRGPGLLEFCPGPMLRCSDYFTHNPSASGSEPLSSRMMFVDELNRISETTLAVLLEAMAQNRVQIPSLLATPREAQLPGFFLVAAQNPSHHVGVGQIPEAVLDRFMVRLDLKTPSESVTEQILDRRVSLRTSIAPKGQDTARPPIQARVDVAHIRRRVREVRFGGEIDKNGRSRLIGLASALQSACRSLLDAGDAEIDSRNSVRKLVDANVTHGFGLRGLFSLVDLAQTCAWLTTPPDQEPVVTLSHLHWAAPLTLNHRLQFKEGRLPRVLQQMDFVRQLCRAVWPSP